MEKEANLTFPLAGSISLETEACHEASDAAIMDELPSPRSVSYRVMSRILVMNIATTKRFLPVITGFNQFLLT